jgi:sec-independent protein translocase protein TatA
MSNTLLFIGNLGGGEWIIIILVVLLLFGGKKIPELMRGIGQGMREFNDAKNSVKTQIEDGMKEKDKAKAKEETK